MNGIFGTSRSSISCQKREYVVNRVDIAAAIVLLSLSWAGQAAAGSVIVQGNTGGVALLNAVAGATYQITATGVVNLAVGQGDYDVDPNGIIVSPIATNSASYAFFSSFGNPVVGGFTTDPFSFSPDVSPVPGGRYGVLTGKWSTGGGWFVIGANEKVVVPTSGAKLLLSVNDSNYLDNAGFFTVTITAVPEPATWALMLMGFGGLGAVLRSRRNGAVLAAT